MAVKESGEQIYDGDSRSVHRVGDQGGGGAWSEYRVHKASAQGRILGVVRFQSDLPSRVGFEGWTNEGLLAVVKDRLEAFQAGGYPSEWNEKALKGVNHALKALEMRTADRENRGVKGTYEE